MHPTTTETMARIHLEELYREAAAYRLAASARKAAPRSFNLVARLRRAVTSPGPIRQTAAIEKA